ncbi:PhoX family protein [Paenibacillus allorhizoplanae]|nr:alkaline phosphatase PhoX [Paenibacillus allorhizoplanae]
MESKKTFSRRHFLQYLGLSAVSVASTYTGLAAFTQKASASEVIDAYEQLPEVFNPTLHTAADADQLLLSNGYSYQVIAAYGDKINKNGDTFGFNSCYTSFYQLPHSNNEALLWVNHESGQYPWLIDRSKPIVWEQQKQLLYEQGGSLLHLKKDTFGAWKLVDDSSLARRISGLSPIELTGPVRGTSSVHGATRVQGTFANRGGSKTLWNTQLACENQYEATCRDAGLALSHYGWIVEIDPFNVQNQPVKHTALGRFHHGSAAMTLNASNQVVLYMGEDSPTGFVYKFVSKDQWSNGQDKENLLAEGNLYAADFIQGRWIELSLSNVNKMLKSFTYQVPESMYKSKEVLLEQFTTQSDVLTYANEAAQIIGATICDRPSELTLHPIDKSVYIAYTQNTNRGNLHGQIIRLKEKGSTSFEFETFLTGGRQSGFSSPGSLSFDKHGNLWVGSDLAPDQLNSGAWSEFKNNGMYLIHRAGVASKTKQFASAPTEAALSGVSFTENQDTVFVSVNHPGSAGAGTDKPTSQWHRKFGDKNPRSAVVTITL